MKVLLIGPSTKERITNTRWVTSPLGCHYIASYLNKSGYEAKVWDINIDEEPLEKVLDRDWEIIGFSTTEATLEYDIANMHLAKKICPKAILVAGGTGASLNYQEYFNHSPLDIVIQAEGEIPMLELCNMLEDIGFDDAPLHTIPGVIIRTHAKVLSQEEYWSIRKCLDVKAMRASDYWKRTAELYGDPNYDEINTFRLYTTNFCPMNCSFCTLTRLRKYACGKHTPVVALTAEQVLELVFKVLKAYKDCRQIFFVDDDFFINKQRGIEFCEKVIKLKEAGKLPEYLKFICLTNINRIDESNIDVIAKAGFRVLSIGVESTSQHVLDTMDKKQTVEKIWSTTELILKNKIKPYYTLILFSPNSTVQDLVTDLYGFRKLGAIGVGLSVEPYFIPLKGTRFSEEHYPERVRPVKIENTNEVVWKSFAWLPKNPDVQPIFAYFEEIYPKYRKFKMAECKGTHLEKNWQAYVILDALEYSLMHLCLISINSENGIYKNFDKVDTIEHCEVDIVGAIT